MMKTPLTLNDETKVFFENEDKQIWDLILENKVDELLTLLPREKEGDMTFDKILGELFSTGESETLNAYDFITIKEGNSLLARDLVRLIFALDINGNHEEIRKTVAGSLLEPMPDMVEKIQEHAKGQPQNSVNELVMAEGAGIRTVLNGLVHYYQQKEDVTDTLHFVTMLRTQITLAIMGRYKHIVGPDMIDAARIKERIGDKEAAYSFYNAVNSDFRTELNWFIQSAEVGAGEEDVVILSSLKEALLSLDRLNNADQHRGVCAQIDEVLSREHFDEPDFDEEDDED